MPNIQGHHLIILAAVLVAAYLVYRHYKKG